MSDYEKILKHTKDLSNTHDQHEYLHNTIEGLSITKKTQKERKQITEVKKELKKISGVLDKYYTKSEIALNCYNKMLELLGNTKKILFIEPSAGSGVFLSHIKEAKLGFDIAPTNRDIIKNDFLNDNIIEKIGIKYLNYNKVFIGNPPFGNKSSLAIEFVNKALSYSNIVGFIVPIQFRKWSVQSKINKNAQLILDMNLVENAFEFMGKDYKVRCCFQIWVLDSFKHENKNLRLMTRPEISHPDFKMYQYNRTEIAEKYFDYDWDFAVPRQGYLDYSYKAYSKLECNKKQQWIFFKANDKKTLENLLVLDFTKLSKNNTGVPGFGKADVVKEYIKIFK